MCDGTTWIESESTSTTCTTMPMSIHVLRHGWISQICVYTIRSAIWTHTDCWMAYTYYDRSKHTDNNDSKIEAVIVSTIAVVCVVQLHMCAHITKRFANRNRERVYRNEVVWFSIRIKVFQILLCNFIKANRMRYHLGLRSILFCNEKTTTTTTTKAAVRTAAAFDLTNFEVFPAAAFEVRPNCVELAFPCKSQCNCWCCLCVVFFLVANTSSVMIVMNCSFFSRSPLHWIVLFRSNAHA